MLSNTSQMTIFLSESSALVHCAYSTVQLLQRSRLIQHLSENVICVFPRFARLCRSTSYLRWHIKVSFDCLLYWYHFCQKISKSVHVCQSYSKPCVRRFLRHGIRDSGKQEVQHSTSLLPCTHTIQALSANSKCAEFQQSYLSINQSR